MTVGFENDGYVLSLADSEDDLHAAQALRYEVFVRELGGTGDGVDHDLGREADPFDAHSDHLILREQSTGNAIGVYRVLRAEQAARAGGFYTESEYDLAPLKSSGRVLLELGRSCVHADHRSGVALLHLWMGLAQYVELHGAEILFGVASLKGVDMEALAGPLSLLRYRHLAPEDIRPRATPYQRMDLIPETELDRRAAMVQMPSLVKSYLRLGGLVGDGAFVDHDFNCTDVCMIMDTSALNTQAAKLYQPAAAE